MRISAQQMMSSGQNLHTFFLKVTSEVFDTVLVCFPVYLLLLLFWVVFLVVVVVGLFCFQIDSLFCELTMIESTQFALN
jgi:hypothetical protein